MRRLAAAMAAMLAAAAPALGANSASSDQPVIDNSIGLDNMLPTPLTAGQDALSISRDIFTKEDDAYGAFQRGYYLTALALALPRAERADPAAQTLIAEIYAKGLGVAENVAQASS